MHAKNTRETTIILYGSYGYTGRLIASECKARGLQVILSGRKKQPLEKQSEETGYPNIVADLDDNAAVEKLLEKGAVLIHCAGPFQFTARKIVEMCLRTRTHYTDISGEYQVFELLASYDMQAKKAGITILPGTGFDVVPSDCLAVYLKSRLPGASRLELAFAVSKGGFSRGTAKTMVHGLGNGSVIRRDGKLIQIPLGKKIQEIDFGAFKAKCLNIPWGDVSTAWHSTGIPNIEVYAAANSKTMAAAKLSGYLNWLTSSQWVKNFLLQRIDNQHDGPRPEQIDRSKSFLWGRVSDHSGNSQTATIETINGYKLTAKTSVLIAEKILGGNFKTGFQTPGGAFGHGLILEIESTALQGV